MTGDFRHRDRDDCAHNWKETHRRGRHIKLVCTMCEESKTRTRRGRL